MKLIKPQVMLDLLNQKEYDFLRLIANIAMQPDPDHCDANKLMQDTGAESVEELVGCMCGWLDHEYNAETGILTIIGLDQFLDYDYKGYERARKAKSSGKEKSSGKPSGNLPETSGKPFPESKNLPENPSGKPSGKQKNQINRDFSGAGAGFSGKPDTYIYINKDKDIYIDAKAIKEALDKVWQAYPVGRQGSREKAVQAWADAGLRAADADRIVDAIKILRKSKSWQGEYIPAVSTLIKDRLYVGVTSDEDKPVSAILPIDEALEKSKADAARALREHPEWFPFAVLNNKGGDQND